MAGGARRAIGFSSGATPTGAQQWHLNGAPSINTPHKRPITHATAPACEEFTKWNPIYTAQAKEMIKFLNMTTQHCD